MPNIDWKSLGFGFTDVNCHIRYVWKDGKWSEGEFVKDPTITMHIGASCLHYGQECFEGMKAFCQKDGKVVLFRPEENARRMMRTAQRTVMPPVPVDMFIEAAEKKWEREVTSRGTNLSGGQKQRLLVARALAAAPEILILDDSSSALDYKTDMLMRRAIRENHGSTTTVIVAQRVSAIRHADLILVLDDGAVVGRGTHDTLMRDSEIYRSIAEVQMGGESDGSR